VFRGKAPWRRGVVVNFLETQIALVEAGVGSAIIPSFVRTAGMPKSKSIDELAGGSRCKSGFS
jgi:DNA-binding transcriptional LysR family regulator